MITKVKLFGFKGIDAEYDLIQLNLVTGPNGIGKSAIGQAIMLAAWGFIPGCERSPRGIFDFGTIDGGTGFGVEIEYCGTTLRRDWRLKKDAVTQEILVNGKKQKKSDALPLVPSIFDLHAFFFGDGKTKGDNHQIRMLCMASGVDPSRLDDLEVLAGKLRTQKAVQIREVDAARKVHERLMGAEGEQAATDDGGSVLHLKEQIADMQARHLALDDRLKRIRQLESDYKLAMRRLEEIQNAITNHELSEPEPEKQVDHSAEIAEIDAKLETLQAEADETRKALLEIKIPTDVITAADEAREQCLRELLAEIIVEAGIDPDSLEVVQAIINLRLSEILRKRENVAKAGKIAARKKELQTRLNQIGQETGSLNVRRRSLEADSGRGTGRREAWEAEQKRLNALLVDAEKLPPESGDDKGKLEVELSVLKLTIIEKQGLLEQAGRVAGIRDERLKAAADVERWEADGKRIRKEEKDLAAERAKLLDEILTPIIQRITGLLPHGSAKVEIVEDDNGYQHVEIGWLFGSGRYSPWAGLSGGEKAIYGGAFATALTGDGGLVMIEAGEIDEDNLTAMLKRYEQSDIQVIVSTWWPPHLTSESAWQNILPVLCVTERVA